jgi:hypothetical protein
VQPGAEVEVRISLLDLLVQPCCGPGEDEDDSGSGGLIDSDCELADFGPGRAAKAPVGDRDHLDQHFFDRADWSVMLPEVFRQSIELCAPFLLVADVNNDLFGEEAVF